MWEYSISLFHWHHGICCSYPSFYHRIGANFSVWFLIGCFYAEMNFRSQSSRLNLVILVWTHDKKMPSWLLTVSSLWAHGEFTVSSRWPKWSQPAVTEPWPGPWLSCDLSMAEPWSRDWAVIAVIELWPRRDWAVTSPWLSCDLA